MSSQALSRADRNRWPDVRCVAGRAVRRGWCGGCFESSLLEHRDLWSSPRGASLVWEAYATVELGRVDGVGLHRIAAHVSELELERVVSYLYVRTVAPGGAPRGYPWGWRVGYYWPRPTPDRGHPGYPISEHRSVGAPPTRWKHHPLEFPR